MIKSVGPIFLLKIEMLFQHILANVREVAAYYKADFFREGGTLLPYPLNRKSFCQKTLNGNGGYPPPLNGKLPKIFLKKWVKSAKIGVFWPKIAVF